MFERNKYLTDVSDDSCAAFEVCVALLLFGQIDQSWNLEEIVISEQGDDLRGVSLDTDSLNLPALV
jgi:hypothetical protein